MYDDLMRQERANGHLYYNHHVQYHILPLSIRVMKTGNYEEQSMHQKLNVLATGGTFGMNFNRTANILEASILIDELDCLGLLLLETQVQTILVELYRGLESIEDKSNHLPILLKFIKTKISGFDKLEEGSITAEYANKIIYHHANTTARFKIVPEIIKILFSKPFSKLSRIQELQLENHQINCAVIALLPIFNNNFDEIDRVLESRPLMKGKNVSYYKSAKQRHAEVMQMAGS
jgi:hypothetical protein